MGKSETQIDIPMSKIKNWLSNPEADYAEGLELLRPHISNKVLFGNLVKKENAFNRQKLTYELSKVQEIPEIEEPKTGEPKTGEPETGEGKPETGVMETGEPENAEAPQNASEAHTEASEAPKAPEASEVKCVTINDEEAYKQPTKCVAIVDEEAYTLLTERIGKLYTEKAKLSNSLREQKTDEQRRQVVGMIDHLEGQLAELNSQKAYYDEHGKFPEAPKSIEVKDPGALAGSLKNIRSNISKARAALERNPGGVNKREKLAKLEAQRDELELQLKQFKIE
jgi:hypothetical protein